MKYQDFLKRCLAALTIIFFVAGYSAATVIPDWPDWEDGKRKIKVYVDGDKDLKDSVDKGVDTWNEANSDNDWEFEVTDNPDEADVTVSEGKLDSGTMGECSPNIEDGEITSMDVTIDEGLSDKDRDDTVLHELGHCLRIDDTDNEGDVMRGSGDIPSDPSKNDKEEAEASDEDPPCPLEASANLVRDCETTITFSPKSGSGIFLSDVAEVYIESKTGNDLVADVLGWNADGIEVSFAVFGSAGHNEVVGITLLHEDGYMVEHTSVITINDEKAPADYLPHSVAGRNIDVTAGRPVILDGRASYHDADSIFFAGSWIVYKNGEAFKGIIGTYGKLTLPPGSYTATHIVQDYYGRISKDTIAIKVNEPLVDADPVTVPGDTSGTIQH